LSRDKIDADGPTPIEPKVTSPFQVYAVMRSSIADVAAAEANAEARAEGALVLVEIVEETREDINYLR
jgi:hypothetical protein